MVARTKLYQFYVEWIYWMWDKLITVFQKTIFSKNKFWKYKCVTCISDEESVVVQFLVITISIQLSLHNFHGVYLRINILKAFFWCKPLDQAIPTNGVLSPRSNCSEILSFTCEKVELLFSCLPHTDAYTVTQYTC